MQVARGTCSSLPDFIPLASTIAGAFRFAIGRLFLSSVAWSPGPTVHGHEPWQLLAARWGGGGTLAICEAACRTRSCARIYAGMRSDWHVAT